MLCVKKEKKFGFSREASYCPRPHLLIYGLVKEISHLSFFICFLLTIPLFSSLSFFIEFFFECYTFPKNRENKGGREKDSKELHSWSKRLNPH